MYPNELITQTYVLNVYTDSSILYLLIYMLYANTLYIHLFGGIGQGQLTYHLLTNKHYLYSLIYVITITITFVCIHLYIYMCVEQVFKITITKTNKNKNKKGQNYEGLLACVYMMVFEGMLWLFSSLQ